MFIFWTLVTLSVAGLAFLVCRQRGFLDACEETRLGRRRSQLSRLFSHDDYQRRDAKPKPRKAIQSVVDFLRGLSKIFPPKEAETHSKKVTEPPKKERMLGNYRLLDKIGAGGMGVVYRGEHRLLQQPVAIKTLVLDPVQEAHLQDRFYLEMRTLAQLRHDNIVRAFDAGETLGSDGQMMHYLVMEYVPGRDLEEFVLEQGPLSIERTCALIRDICLALGEVHRLQLVHRDVKPANIRLTPEGRAKLVDFGLARCFQNRLTRPGTVLGSLAYMSPEQARDSTTIDGRADLYALGACFFWCLTGKHPFPQQDLSPQAFEERQRIHAPSVRKFRPEVPVEIDVLIRQMMANRVEERTASAAEVVKALENFCAKSEASSVANASGSDNLGGALVRLMELRNLATAGQLRRIGRYCRVLAEAMPSTPEGFPALLERAAPLCDIGKLLLPDHVLFHPGKLEACDQRILESHGELGAEYLTHLAEQPGCDAEWLRLAAELAKFHHERGEDVPIGAKLLAIALAYDSLRSRGPSKPPLPHAAAVEIMKESNFDAECFGVFMEKAAACEGIYREGSE